MRLSPLILLCLLAGCAAPSGFGGAYTGGGNVQAGFGAIKRMAETKNPATFPLIVKQAEQGEKDSTSLLSALDEQAKANGILRDEKVKAETQLVEERNQWFGDRTHRLTGWIIGIAIAVWAIIGLLGVYLAPASRIGKTLLNLIPLSGPFAAWAKRRTA